jgi:hypothetical protein
MRIEQRIIKLLMESGLTISEQLEVIKGVQERLQFCKLTGMKQNQPQTKLEL